MKRLTIRYLHIAETLALVAALIMLQLSSSSEDLPRWMLHTITLFTVGTVIFCSIRLIALSPIISHRTKRHLIETRRLLRRQQDALQQITGNKNLFSGDFRRASRIISEIAADTLELDHVALWLIDPNSGLLEHYYSYNRINSPTLSFAITPLSLSNDDLLDLNEHRVITMDADPSRLSGNPLMCHLIARSKSSVIAPLRLDADIIGFLVLHDTEIDRTWNSDEQSFAASIADSLSMAKEVERRRLVEKELKRRSVALESTADGMAILNTEKEFIFVNNSLLRMFGFSSPYLILGKKWRVLYSREEGDRLERQLKPLLRVNGKARVEATAALQGQGQFFHELSLTSLETGGYVCTVTDRTERQQIEKNLTRHKRFLDQVINANPNLIFVKDSRGRFSLVNQAVADIYGTTIQDLIGKSDADFNEKSNEVDHFREHDRIVIEEERDLFIPEEIITDAQGELHYLQTTKRPIKLGPNEQTQVLGVATDITERKKLEEQLVQAQKMDAIGQLAGGIAHDFNNYLTGIIGYTALLKSSSKSEDIAERSHAVEMIENIARKATQLTEKLLGFARKGKNRDIPVDLHDTIQETFALLSRTIEKSVIMKHELDATRFHVIGDPMQLQQIILNLAINARDAILNKAEGEGTCGEITFRTTDVLIEAGDLERTPDMKPGSYLSIEATDTGCGMVPKIIDKIFEPFFTTKEPGKGTGMGLAMVYGIVRNHGGTVQVTSTPNAGTTFTILLPSSSNTSKIDIEKTQEDTVNGKGHILVVDDHQVVREVTARMLSSLGYDVVTARDGVEALQYYDDNSTEIDLVILDMIMPNMGAWECFRALKKVNPDVRAILSTGYSNNHAVQEIMNEGMLGFVQKPYQLEQLSKVVATVLQNKIVTRDIPFSALPSSH